MFGQKKRLAARILELELEVKRLVKYRFREGDVVYINDGERSPLMPFYLRKSYNGGDCYYVTRGKDDIIREGLSYSVNVRDISLSKPKCCAACGSLI